MVTLSCIVLRLCETQLAQLMGFSVMEDSRPVLEIAERFNNVYCGAFMSEE